MIRVNFPEIEISWEDGWKHWQDSDLFNDNSDYKGKSDTFYLIIVRNPYDWIRSTKRKPHHILNPSENLSEFIRQKQYTLHVSETGKDDPDNIKSVDSNIITLRNRKNKGNKILLDKVTNSKLIKCEFSC